MIQLIRLCEITIVLIIMLSRKEPVQLYDKLLSKGNKGVQDLSSYLEKLAAQSLKQPEQITKEFDAIVNFFISKAKNPPNNEYHRAYIVMGLQTIGFQVEKCVNFNRYLYDIATQILTYFSDGSEKVKFTAISSLYNLLNKYSERGLEMFLQAFEAVAELIADSSGQVRQAAEYLNQTLKTLINNTVFDQKSFDLRGFIEILSEKIQTGPSNFKEFLLDWLMTIEEIPHFQLSFDLPLFFRQVFELLLSDSKSLRTKAEQCLKKFLHVFRQIFALGGCLSSKLSHQNAQVLIQTILILIRQNLSPQITYQSLQWLETFTKFFTKQVGKKCQKFMEPIYAAFFKEIILVIITTLSDESQKIRKASQRINEALLHAFPTMSKQAKKMNETSILLQQLLRENRLASRVEAIFKWIILLLNQNTEQMLTQLNSLLGHLVERLCDKNATKSLFLLLEGSLFVQDYFHLLIQTLLGYLSQNQQVSPQPIFRQLLSLTKAERHFLDVCRRVRHFQNSRFQYRLLENLITILVTEPNLQSLRIKLQSPKKEDIVLELFQCFCRNEAALVILGFLSQQYFFVIELFKIMAHWEKLNHNKLRSLVKISNLIEHSNLNQLRTDLRKSGLAVRAYLSLLMALPHGKYHNLLLQRLPPQMKPLPQEKITSYEERFSKDVLKFYQSGWKEQQKEPTASTVQ